MKKIYTLLSLFWSVRWFKTKNFFFLLDTLTPRAHDTKFVSNTLKHSLRLIRDETCCVDTKQIYPPHFVNSFFMIIGIIYSRHYFSFRSTRFNKLRMFSFNISNIWDTSSARREICSNESHNIIVMSDCRFRLQQFFRPLSRPRSIDFHSNIHYNPFPISTLFSRPLETLADMITMNAHRHMCNIS